MVIAQSDRNCRVCRIALRRGQQGELCDACAREARTWSACPVPEGFFDTKEMQQALGNYDFGTVFRAVRKHAEMSQHQFAGAHRAAAVAGVVDRAERAPAA